MFQKFFGIERILWIGDGSRITFFRLNFFCLTVPKKVAAGTLFLRNVLASNFFGIMGVMRFFRKFSVSQLRKIS